jgi:hypothetical protein
LTLLEASDKPVLRHDPRVEVPAASPAFGLSVRLRVADVPYFEYTFVTDALAAVSLALRIDGWLREIRSLAGVADSLILQ